MKKLILLSASLFLFFATACKKEIKKEIKKEKVTTNKQTEKKQSRKIIPNVQITLKNVKTRDSVFVDKMRFLTSKSAIYTTFADSLDIQKTTIFNRNPETKEIGYKIKDDEFINFSIDVTLEKYNYFLKANDKLVVEFDENGFVTKSILNGDENHPALLLAKNTIPIKSIAYLKFMKKHYFRANDKKFENKFKKDFSSKIKSLNTQLSTLANKLDKKIFFALKKHIKLHTIKNEFSKGLTAKIEKNDAFMAIAAYRNLSDKMLQKINEINYLDNEKVGIQKAFKVVDILMNNTEFKNKPKTAFLIFRELLNLTGSYEPNFIPELIAKIPDSKTRKFYLKNYSNEYILEHKEKRNDTENLNLVSSSEFKKVSTFNDFLKLNRGKIIYVDLWASWCGPCKRQLKSSYKLKKELKDKPIVFAYFSIDMSFSKWKTASMEEEMGENVNSFLFLNTKKSKRYLSWNVRGIPRYLIFDKNGNLINKNAPSPEDATTKDLLIKHTNN